ncbi:MAG: hypothetical protein ACK4Z5_00755 [Brevundimonas sp.]
MIRSLMVVAAAAAAFALGAGQASAASTNACYIECQYRCHLAHPGGGAAWESCYVACARTKCGAVAPGG